MKLTVIGGGGVRSIFLAKSISLKAKSLNINEVVFMDNDAEKLNIYGNMAKEVARRLDDSLKFSITTDPVEAVKDADYVITTIRVGGEPKRIDDERIALNLGVIGQETTGAAGFSYAMRSVTILAKYCELIKQYSKKDVKVFNFTNPAGVVSQTLRDMGYDFTFGICDAPSTLLHDISKVYGVEPDDVRGRCFGLNHFSFFDSVKICGEEKLDDIINNDEVYEKTDMRFFNKKVTKDMGYMLNEYLYYFLYREKAYENIMSSPKTRGEVIYEVTTNMSKELKNYDPQKDFEKCIEIFEKWYGIRESLYMQNETKCESHKDAFKFDIYEKDLGGYAGVALKYIESEQKGTKANMIFCVPNMGAIKGLLDTDIVEVSCELDNGKYTLDKFDNVDEFVLEQIRRVKIYERLSSKAIIEKSKDVAIKALFAHPLVNSYSLATELVDKYIESNKDYIDGWK